MKYQTDSDSKPKSSADNDLEIEGIGISKRHFLSTEDRNNDYQLVSWLKVERLESSPKQVTFADKLIVNEDSLDSDMLERIKHNLEYNDDR